MKLQRLAGALAALSTALPISASAYSGGAGPPPASSGQCYGRVWLPGPLPARRARRSRPVLVRPAHAERVWAPARYRTVYTHAATTQRWVTTPARYEIRTVRTVVEPGQWVWERRFAPVVSGSPEPGQTLVTPTGEIMCKVWRPARYAYATKRVLVSPARRHCITVKASRGVTRRVLVRPAGWTTRVLPAVYRRVATSPPAAPWTPGRPQEGWAPVICGGPLSREAMQRLQSALVARGYDPGPADGVERPQTYGALARFQHDRGMAWGQITVESARALGVIR